MRNLRFWIPEQKFLPLLALCLAGGIATGLWAPEMAQAKKSASQGSTKAYDIYLTGNRICKKCVARYLGNDQVELRDRKGETGVYPLWEIQGVDTHPFARRFWGTSFRGIGLPGRIIVPQAFDDEKGLSY